ncbi:MAG: hypothetical protein M0Q93_12830 [Terrimicrobiaceae bacterium]|nr:hypothetical protein [Terrimicrobiaceae bacterium]
MAFTDKQKVDQLSSLLTDYPEKRDILETLINARKHSATRLEGNRQAKNDNIAPLQTTQ